MCINEAVYKTIHDQAERIITMNGGTLEEMNYEEDHVHILLSLPPQACLSSVINNIKTTTARLVRRDHEAYITKFYWKPYFWSRSYMILSSGGAPTDVIQKYIQEQGTEHQRKAGQRRPGRKTANPT